MCLRVLNQTTKVIGLLLVGLTEKVKVLVPVINNIAETKLRQAPLLKEHWLLQVKEEEWVPVQTIPLNYSKLNNNYRHHPTWTKQANCMKLNLPLPLQPEWSVLLDVSCEIPQIQGEGNRPWYRHLGQEMPLGLPWQSGLWSDRFLLPYQVAGIPVDT